MFRPDNPLILQSDHTVLVEVASPKAKQARDLLLGCAELVKSPEYIHTWRLTPLSLWNAAAAGHTTEGLIDALEALAKYPVPENVPATIRSRMARYGALRLLSDGRWLRLEGRSPVDLEEVRNLKAVEDLLGEPLGPLANRVHPRRRGELKQVLTSCGHPVEDLVGYEDGDALEMTLSTSFRPREYQRDAVAAFSAGPSGGSGVVVLPCGAGKTLVGIMAMVALGMKTLVLCTGHTALQQWKAEILKNTSLTEDQVGEYSGGVRELRPVTLTTYQMLTWRPAKEAPPPHFKLFHEGGWGLIVYDEVHLLPAPIFRETAWLQARRRLGLTATLVREDGREGDVFALIGPKRFDLPWKELEAQGWIAEARCVEVRVALSDEDRLGYVRASPRARFPIAAKNARKGPIVERLLERHAEDQVLVLGTYLDQLGWIARRFKLDIVTGKTPTAERERLFSAFREGQITRLALSRVGNFAIDLPGANVAIQIAGTFGSRQEEAQRLGRVLRPKDRDNQALFYSVVSAETQEQEMAERRQMFLAEQGYPYRIEVAS